jgi:hypothetical protein
VAQRRLVDEHQALWPHLVPQQEAADAARQRG